MKKVFLPMAIALAASCSCQVIPTKVEFEDCHCLICEACDSLDSLEAYLVYETLQDINGIPFSAISWTENTEYRVWYDSLTTLLVDEIDSWPMDSVVVYAKDLKACPKLMHQFDLGYDGLCGWDAYPKRFGKDAYKWIETTEGERLYVRNDIKDDMELFQIKVDSVFNVLFPEDEED